MEISLSDFGVFSEVLTEELHRKVIEMHRTEQVDWAFLARGTGQSVDLDPYMELLLGRFDFSKTVELILHVAYDYSELDKCVFWKRSRVIEQIGSMPNYEYAASALHDVSNMYFHQRWNNNEPPFMDTLALTLLKVYAAQFKSLHANVKAPFKQSEICGLIWNYLRDSFHNRTDAMNKKIREAVHMHRQNLLLVLRLCDEVSESDARLEILVSILGDASQHLDDGIDLVEYYRLSSNLGNKECFEVINVTDLAEHFSTYLKPAANLILSHLDALLHSLDDHSFEICNFGTGTTKTINHDNICIGTMIKTFPYLQVTTWT